MIGNVRGILGDPGAGKTVKLTSIAYESYRNGMEVVSNYRLRFPHYEVRFDQLGKVAKQTICGCLVGKGGIQPGEKCRHGNPPFLENKVLCYAEMGRGADSYNFLSKQNSDIADLVFQIRHFGAYLWYDAQRWGIVTTRVRRLTNYFMLLDPVEADPEYVAKHPEKVGNNLDKPIGRLPDGKCIIKGVADIALCDDAMRLIRTLPRFDGRPYMGLYDTRENIFA